MGRKSNTKKQGKKEKKNGVQPAGAASGAAAKRGPAAATNPPSPTLQRVGRVAAIVLGSLFLLAGTFKIGDPWSFVGSLPAYGIPDALRVPVALIMPTIEVILGLMLIAGWRVRETSMATAGFLAVFGAVIAYGWSAGTLEDCGCFGPFLKSSPPMALARDGGMMVLAVLGFLWAPVDGLRFTASFSRLRIGTIATVAVASFALIASILFADEGTLDERLAAAEARSVESAPSLASLALGEREHVFLYLFAPDCSHCIDAGPTMARMAADPDLPEIVGITTTRRAGETRYYMQHAGATFKAYEMPPASFMRITGDGSVPQLVHMQRGKIVRIWGGQNGPPLPDVDGLKTYMSLQ